MNLYDAVARLEQIHKNFHAGNSVAGQIESLNFDCEQAGLVFRANEKQLAFLHFADCLCDGPDEEQIYEFEEEELYERSNALAESDSEQD